VIVGLFLTPSLLGPKTTRDELQISGSTHQEISRHKRQSPLKKAYTICAGVGSGNWVEKWGVQQLTRVRTDLHTLLFDPVERFPAR